MKSNKFYTELLTDSLPSMGNLLKDIISVSQDSQNSCDEFKNFLRDMISIINQENQNRMKQSFDPMDFISVSLSSYPANSSDAKKIGDQINFLRNTIHKIIKDQKKNLLLRNSKKFLNLEKRILNKYNSDISSFYSELNKKQNFDISHFVEKISENSYMPIPNIYAHEYVKSFFPPSFFPIDQMYLSQFLSRIKRDETNQNVQNLQLTSLLDKTENMREQIFKMNQEIKYEYDIDKLVNSNPENETVMSHSFSQSMRKQMTSYLHLINDQKNDLLLNQQKIDILKGQLNDILTSIQEFPTICESKNCEFPCIAEKINAIDNETRSLHYINGIMGKVQFQGTKHVIQPVKEYLENKKRIEFMFESILKNGIKQDSYREIRNIIDYLDELIPDLKTAKQQASTLSSSKERTLQKMMRANSNQQPPPQSSTEMKLNDLKPRVLKYSKNVIRAVEEKMKEKNQLMESIKQCAEELSNIETPHTYLSFFLENTSDEKIEHKWLIQVKESLEELISKQKETLEQNRTKMEKIRKELANESIPTKENTESFQLVGSQFVYDGLLQKCSCPLCGCEISYCVGRCGHCVCENCAQKATTAKPYNCPVCGISVNQSDFINIQWD